MAIVRPEYFERELKVALHGSLEQMNAELAAFAKSELRRVIAEGIASPIYERYVNGIHGAPEESVKIPNGILYTFSNWPLVINAALAELKKRSPVVSGRYANSFIVIVDDHVVSDFAAIAASAEVIITNFQPYVRKLENGRNKKGRKHRIIDGARSVMASRYRGAFRFQTMYLNIAAGVHQGMPYILKGHQRSGSVSTLATWYGVPKPVIEGWLAQGKRLGTVDLTARPAAQDRRSSAFRAGRDTLAGRKDSQAGMPISYPSIVINVEA
jgi:hypothetical protein